MKNKTLSYEETVEKAASDETSLGSILLRRELITKLELEDALDIQRQGVPPLGEILVLKGYVPKLQLEAALLEQKMLRGQATPDEFAAFSHKVAEETKAALDGAEKAIRSVGAEIHELLKAKV